MSLDLLRMTKPCVSVVMTVKNGENYLAKSIDSILSQSFDDFELIVINDGSTDHTLEILEGYDDPRIRVISQSNRGVARAANRGLVEARGQYIARQDHDDISFVSRLEEQVRFLDMYPEIALVGCAAEIWVDDEFDGRYHDHPTDPAELAIELLFNNPFVHSSIMYRKEILGKIGLYDPSPEITPLDDYDFISRVASKYPVANLALRLVAYREAKSSLTSEFRVQSKARPSALQAKLANISTANISRAIGLVKTNKICDAFGKLIHNVSFSARDIKLADIDSLLWAVFVKTSKRLDIRDTKLLEIYSIKVDNLKFRWYSKSGPAGLSERFWYFFKNTFLRKLSHCFQLLGKYIYSKLK